jgi:hypothetical protein
LIAVAGTIAEQVRLRGGLFTTGLAFAGTIVEAVRLQSASLLSKTDLSGTLRQGSRLLSAVLPSLTTLSGSVKSITRIASGSLNQILALVAGGTKAVTRLHSTVFGYKGLVASAIRSTLIARGAQATSTIAVVASRIRALLRVTPGPWSLWWKHATGWVIVESQDKEAVAVDAVRSVILAYTAPERFAVIIENPVRAAIAVQNYDKISVEQPTQAAILEEELA